MQDWSIIIPTRNEEAHIGLCLTSIRDLEWEQEAVEVIVVDNGSVDRTLAIANSYSQLLNIRVISMPQGRVGGLRNAGARLASGKFLAFLDADCVVEPLWLQHADGVLRKRPFAITGSNYVLPLTAGWPARIWHARFQSGRTGEVSYLPGGNLLISRPLFWELGGFDPCLSSNEDSQFCTRARAAGIPVIAFPELAVTHLGAEKSLAHFVRRQIWHGSNVVNRAGLKGNARAIALATYTLFCFLFICASALILQPAFTFAGLLAIIFPAVSLAFFGCPRTFCFKNMPRLIFLLVTYGMVRASVLPVALFRAVRSTSMAAISGMED